MSLAADALQPLIVRGLIAFGGRPEIMTIPDVLTIRRAAYDLDFDATDQSILVDFRDSETILRAVAADASRLSSASFQSISNIGTEALDRDMLVWSLIKLYYAAFYSGHSLIRLLGEGCSFFDQQHVTRIKTYASAIGRTPPFAIEGGLYRCIVSPNSTGLRCLKAHAGTGGTHESFWGLFSERLKNISEEVLRGALAAADAQAVFGQLEALRNIIRRHGRYSWLSAIRNEIQYRQQHGVWFPLKVNRKDRQFLSRKVGQWNGDPMLIDLDPKGTNVLGVFASACVFVVSLCLALLTRIADRSPAGNRSFVRFGPLALLNTAQTAPK